MHLDTSLLTLKRLDWDSVSGSKPSNEICDSPKHLKSCSVPASVYVSKQQPLTAKFSMNYAKERKQHPSLQHVP